VRDDPATGVLPRGIVATGKRGNGETEEHPDWDEYRQVMGADKRVLMALRISHVYGAALR
jgi:hypothetical protein